MENVSVIESLACGIMRLLVFSLLVLCLLFIPACKRKPPSLEAIDVIDRRTNLEIPPPIERDLAQIRERGSLVVLAPYNSTTYFIYQGEPLGYEYELLRAFAKDIGVPMKVVVAADPKSLFALLNSGDGDIAAGRIVPPTGPTTALQDQAPVAFTRALYRTQPALVQQEQGPDAAGEGTEKALEPGPANPAPEVDIDARLISRPAQLSGRTVNLPEKSEYKRTLVELSDEISGEIHVVEMGGKIQDETLAQKVARGEVQFTVMQSNIAD